MVAGPYLLDTNALIWAATTPEKLSTMARKAILQGTLALSVVSYWEVVIKARKGALTVGDPVTWWSRVTELIGGEILSVRAAHISALSGLPDLHKDPFDRLLVAQAAAEGLTLVTSDRLIAKYKIKVAW